MLSLVIPVYKNSSNIRPLLQALRALPGQLSDKELEVVFVVDGSPDKVTDVTDVWTFAREVTSRNPNWKLVATEAGQ